MSDKIKKSPEEVAVVKAARQQLAKALALQAGTAIVTAALAAATSHYVSKALNKNAEPMKVYVTNETNV